MMDTFSRSDLLAEFETEWTYIERRCAGLGEKRLLSVGGQGEWSAKDTLCHLSAWEKYLLDRLSYVMTGQQPHYPQMATREDIDCFNAQVYMDNRDRSLSSALQDFRNTYHGVVTVLQALDEELFTQAYSYDWPDDQLTLLQLIRVNTCDHFREHRKTFE